MRCQQGIKIQPAFSKRVSQQDRAAAYFRFVGMKWWYRTRNPEPWQLHLLQLCCWSALGWVIPPDPDVPQRCPQCSNYPCCLLTAAPFWGCRGLAWCWPPASLLEEGGGSGPGGESEDKVVMRRRGQFLDSFLPRLIHSHTQSERLLGFFSHTRTVWVKVFIYEMTTFFFFFQLLLPTLSLVARCITTQNILRLLFHFASWSDGVRTRQHHVQRGLLTAGTESSELL